MIKYMDFDTSTSINGFFKPRASQIISIETVQTAGRSIFRVWFKE